MLNIVTPATAEPVTLAEAKAHLNVIHDADDSKIEGYITAARETVELFTGRALAAAGYSWEPVVEVDAVPAKMPLRPATVTSPEDDRPILFTTVPGEVPGALKNAILLMVGDFYTNTDAMIVGTIVAQNPAVHALMFPYRLNMGV